MSKLPPYAQIKRYLKQGLERGRWAPLALMPSEAELVHRFSVSRMTVNRALRELQGEGLVTRSQGRGTFAAPRQQLQSTLTLPELHEEIAARGNAHQVHVCLAETAPAHAELAAQLGLPVRSMVFHTVIVHSENGVPLQCEDRYVNPACAPKYLQADFQTTPPSVYLMQVAPHWQAHYSIEAGTATAAEAQWLGVPGDAPCLVVVRRTSSRGVPISLARLVHPGKRYALRGELAP